MAPRCKLGRHPAENALRCHLAAYPGDQVADIADKAGINIDLVWRARRGHDLQVDTYLRLTAVIGFDPITGASIPPTAPGPVIWDVAGIAFGVSRYLNGGLTLRQAARAIGISATTLGVAERGRPVSVTSFLSACSHFGLAPQSFCLTEEPFSAIHSENQTVTTHVTRENAAIQMQTKAVQ